MRLRTEKGTKVAGNLLHVSSYQGSNIKQTEHWSIVGWTTHKTLPFCFCPILITSCLHRKDARLSARYIFAFQKSLGTRLNTRLSTPAQLQFRVPERGSLGTRLGEGVASCNLPHPHTGKPGNEATLRYNCAAVKALVQARQKENCIGPPYQYKYPSGNVSGYA